MLGVIWYILLLIVTIVGLNIIIDYKRYGKKIFDCFKKPNKVNMKDLLVNIFKNEIKNKMLILERNDNYFIAITKYDVFLIQLINEGLSITGNINDETLRVIKSHIKEIKNPLPQFINDIKLLLNNKIEIKPIIVKTNKQCSLNLKDFDKRNIFSLEDFSYLLYRLQHSTSKYTEDEIDDVYNNLKEILNGNN